MDVQLALDMACAEHQVFTDGELRIYPWWTREVVVWVEREDGMYREVHEDGEVLHATWYH